MAETDRLAVAAGVQSLTLMENAGRAVADAAMKMVPPGARIIVLCGPGNNGGDGFVAARLLRERGYDVALALFADRLRLSGDAAIMAARWTGGIAEDWPALLDDPDLVIDALFGAGLTRPIIGDAGGAIVIINLNQLKILAVDIPSGIDGNTGAPIGDYVVNATRTVTFFRLKPGHLLLPGREHCGDIVLSDIGIPETVLDVTFDAEDNPRPNVMPAQFHNIPPLWLAELPRVGTSGHKYTRGHAVVVSGPAHATGAARLGARGALRVGAGLVTVASPLDSVATNASHLTAIMLKPFEGPRGLADILTDARRNAVLIGPGCGVSIATRLLTQVALEFDAACVLDADALTSFTLDQSDDPEPVINHLFTLIKEKPDRPVVITPHDGEFKRLFPDLTGDKLSRARAAAERSGAIVILKGPDTVIASPDGSAAINNNAPPWLATAGSGDVLAGFITGLLAQGMSPWHAACAAVWLHGECANYFGPGLIAEDIPEVLPQVLTNSIASPYRRSTSSIVLRTTPS
ncbi:MAG: NAD(P)H-hydrate dehydratase [Hyphomicrobiaceae bacterium]|nr:NAD(P)H-hydrate dehydratase [Hyphomicrobiaceae bacterium]